MNTPNECKSSECPQCAESLVYPRGDTPYCEECGWPDECREPDHDLIEEHDGEITFIHSPECQGFCDYACNPLGEKQAKLLIKSRQNANPPTADTPETDAAKFYVGTSRKQYVDAEFAQKLERDKRDAITALNSIVAKAPSRGPLWHGSSEIEAARAIAFLENTHVLEHVENMAFGPQLQPAERAGASLWLVKPPKGNATVARIFRITSKTMDSDQKSMTSPPTSQTFHTACGSESLMVRTMLVIDHVATGHEIRKRRESAKLSLRKVAIECAWSASFQSDLELGHRAWTEEKCLKVETAIKKLSLCANQSAIT